MSLSIGMTECVLLMQGDVLGVLKIWASRTAMELTNELLVAVSDKFLSAVESSFPWERHCEGYVAQGVTLTSDKILYSVYPKTGYAPESAVSKVEIHNRDSHEKIGSFELPKEIKHAGGMAIDKEGNLLVSDTHALYKIDLKKAEKDGHCEHAVLGKRKLENGVQGSSIAYDSKTGRVLVVQFHNITQAEGFFFDTQQIFENTSDVVLSGKEALGAVKLPCQVQGAAWDAQGNLWLSRSNLWTKGEVCRIDESTGEILERHQLIAGLQDIEFDNDGKLWTLSEAGAKPYEWMTHVEFAKVFQLNMNNLKDTATLESGTCSLTSMSADESVGNFARKVIEDFARLTGRQPVDVVVTRNVPNAEADVGITWIKGDETLYINPDFVQENCDSPDKLAGVILHEAGHIYANHGGYSADIASNHAGEFQADIFSARAMESLGFDKMEFANLVKTFGSASDTHPAGYARYTVIKTMPAA